MKKFCLLIAILLSNQYCFEPIDSIYDRFIEKNYHWITVTFILVLVSFIFYYNKDNNKDKKKENLIKNTENKNFDPQYIEYIEQKRRKTMQNNIEKYCQVFKNIEKQRLLFVLDKIRALKKKDDNLGIDNMNILYLELSESLLKVGLNKDDQERDDQESSIILKNIYQLLEFYLMKDKTSALYYNISYLKELYNNFFKSSFYTYIIYNLFLEKEDFIKSINCKELKDDIQSIISKLFHEIMILEREIFDFDYEFFNFFEDGNNSGDFVHKLERCDMDNHQKLIINSINPFIDEKINFLKDKKLIFDDLREQINDDCSAIKKKYRETDFEDVLKVNEFFNMIIRKKIDVLSDRYYEDLVLKENLLHSLKNMYYKKYEYFNKKYIESYDKAYQNLEI